MNWNPWKKQEEKKCRFTWNQIEKQTKKDKNCRLTTTLSLACALSMLRVILNQRFILIIFTITITIILYLKKYT